MAPSPGNSAAEPAIVASQPLPAAPPAEEPSIVSSGPLPPKPFAEHLSNILSEFGQDVGGAVTGTGKALLDIPGFLESWQQDNNAIAGRAAGAFKSGDYVNGVKHLAYLASQIMPGMGAAGEKMGDALDRGDYDSAAGQALALLTVAKAPDMVSGLAPKVAAGFKAGGADVAAGAAKAGAGVAVNAVLPAGTPEPIRYGLGGGPIVWGGKQIVEGVTKGMKAAWNTPMGPGILERLPSLADYQSVLADYLTGKVKEAKGAAAGSAPSSPPMAPAADQMFAPRSPVEGAPAGGSSEPFDIPEGKQAVEMPSLGDAPVGRFGGLNGAGGSPAPAAWVNTGDTSGLQIAPEVMARSKVAQNLSQALDAKGITPNVLSELAKDDADWKLFWDQESHAPGISSAKNAGGYTASKTTIAATQDALQDLYDAKPADARPSPKDEAKALFDVKQRLHPQPLTYKMTQDPDVAANLSEGAVRVNPDGTKDVLSTVNTADISPEPNNKPFPSTKARYQQALQARKLGYTEDMLQNPDEKPPREGEHNPPTDRQIFRQSAVQPTLRKTPDGELVVFDGHHRVAAEFANAGGDTNIRAWMPMAGKSPVTISPEIQQMVK